MQESPLSSSRHVPTGSSRKMGEMSHRGLSMGGITFKMLLSTSFFKCSFAVFLKYDLKMNLYLEENKYRCIQMYKMLMM